MRRLSLPIVLASLLTLVPAVGQAALQRVGPVNPAVGYPVWYQDTTGLVLDFCSPTSTLELNGGWCLILPPAFAPEVFPNQFFNEHFYWAANSSLPQGAAAGTATALLTLSVEGAFRSGPVIPGDQITFGRLRITIRAAPVSGDYTIYHPFGQWTFPGLVAGQKLFYTEDVGFNCPPGAFDCALATAIGPYLLPSVTPGGAELPPIPLLTPAQDPFFAGLAAPTPYPGDLATATPKYIADPARLGPVTGSPLAPFVSLVDGLPHNHNTFRIEVLPPGAATPILLDESQLFTLQGRVFEGAIPGQVTVERASFVQPVWASSTAAKLDVFASAFPVVQARIPAGAPPPVGAAPALVFWDAPCTLDAVTLAPIGPPAVGLSHQMLSSGSNYWGQSPPPIPPPSVCVAQTNAVAPGGGLVSVYYAKNVADEVSVSSALYDPNVPAYAVSAISSDQVRLPALGLLDFGPFPAALAGATTTLTSALPAPATAHVTSAGGGAADYQTTTAVVAATSVVPIAANDMVTMFEDCSALPATSCATPQAIVPLANDTLSGAPLVFGPGVTLRLTALPRLGVASYVDAVTGLPVACTAAPCPITSVDGSIRYTPNSNANGTDGFAYTVTTTDAAGLTHTSNIAGISVVITPVNDAPVAVNDTAAGFSSAPITVGVLANDTDPDGFADIVGISNLTQPVGAVAAVDATGRGVVLSGLTAGTGPAPGTYAFAYQARDTAGALSVLPATVTVTVAGVETLTMAAPATFRLTQSRWVITGTDNPPAAQVIRLTYADGPNVGFLLGTATVDPLGNWLFDVKGVTGLSNPTTAQATAVTATGPTGVSVTVPIALK